MKRLLRSKANFEILEGFLSELLGEDILILEILESESNSIRFFIRIQKCCIKMFFRNSLDCHLQNGLPGQKINQMSLFNLINMA